MKHGILLLLTAFLAPLPQSLPAQDPEEIPESVRETPVVRAVRRVRESVVSISVGTDMKNLQLPWWVQRSGFYKVGSGSGVIIDREGLIITNYHVLAGVDRLEKPVIKIDIYNQKRSYTARILHTSVSNDLAVLRINHGKGEVFREIARGRANRLMVGETVIAIGNPFGQEHTVTVGVLSAVNRKMTIRGPNGETFRFNNLLQTDAAVNPGNSGGALVDLTGKLIGINNAIRAESEGINYAIPVDTVNSLLEKQLDIDKGDRFWLGMTVDETSGGLVIGEIVRNGPAWLAGLRRGDRILAVGNRVVRSKKDYNLGFLAVVNKDRKAHFTVRRGGDKFRPEVIAGNKLDRWFYLHMGLAVADTAIPREAAIMLRDTAEVQGIVRPSGVRITRVYEEGPAAKAGLRKGDVLVAYTRADPFGRQVEVHTANISTLLRSLELSGARRPGDKYGFMILRGSEPFRGNLVLR